MKDGGAPASGAELRRLDTDVRESVEQAGGVFDRLEQQLGRERSPELSSDVTWTVSRRVRVHRDAPWAPYVKGGAVALVGAAAAGLLVVAGIAAGVTFTRSSAPEAPSDETRRILASLGSGGLSSSHTGTAAPGGGLSSSNQFAFFEFAPISGAGMTAPCACVNPTGAKGEVLTFSRASAAECYSNNGQTLTQCGNDLARISSGDTASTQVGIWSEATATNSLLRGRDWSDAVWVKTNVSCTLTATGMRNDANAASTCTATLGGGTVLQTITTGAATRSTSLHIKRRTGTGTISATRDNGGTWSDITASLSTTTWKRLVPTQTPGCVGGNCIVVAAMSSGGANPIIGLQFGTNGDAVDVDFAQDETGSFATSPILTAGTATTRAGELEDVALTFGAGTTGVSYAATEVSSGIGFGTPAAIFLGDRAPGVGAGSLKYLSIELASPGTRVSVESTVPPSSSGATYNGADVSIAATPVVRLAAFHTGTLLNSCIAGSCNNGRADTWGAPAFLRVRIGNFAVGTQSIFGVVKGICVDPSSSRCR